MWQIWQAKSQQSPFEQRVSEAQTTGQDQHYLSWQVISVSNLPVVRSGKNSEKYPLRPVLLLSVFILFWSKAAMNNHQSSQAVLQRTQDSISMGEKSLSQRAHWLYSGAPQLRSTQWNILTPRAWRERWDKVFSQALCSSKWGFTILPRFLGSSPFPLK